MFQWRRETLDEESVWDEARSTSLSSGEVLRQIKVVIANGKTTALECKEAGIVEQTHFRWRNEYGGFQVDPGDAGKVISEQGHTARSIRTVLAAARMKLGRCYVPCL